MTDQPVTLYDTTLRDGTQGENITLSLADKLRIARMLDEYGMPYIEGGWPGSNPKDVEFFKAAKGMTWHTARLAAFGSTRHRSNRPEDDPNLRELVAAETPVVTIFGKSWLLHVTEVLGATLARGRLLDEQLLQARCGRVEHLRDELIGVCKDRNVDRRERLMVHAPAVGANGVDGTVDDRLVRRNLGLRRAEAQAQYAGKIQPIEADDEVRLFDQRCGGFARAQAGRGEV